VARPVPEFIVITPVLLLVHVPPEAVLLYVDVAPAHMVLLPLIDGGVVYTVIIAVSLQPVGSVYVTRAVPPSMPVTTPDVAPDVAISLSQLPHVPPVIEALSVVVNPTHTPVAPVITGLGFTVTVLTE
jgi:hypothetical protein